MRRSDESGSPNLTDIIMISFFPPKAGNENSLTVLQRIAGGDKSAVRESVDIYGNLIWAIAKKFTDSKVEAELAVQEIFQDIWRKALYFDVAMSDEKTWVALVARRRLINSLSKNEQCSGAETMNENFRSESDKTAKHLQIYAEIRQSINALKTLNAAQKQILEMSVCDGISPNEISKKTGLTVAEIRLSVNGGLREIRKLVGVSSKNNHFSA